MPSFFIIPDFTSDLIDNIVECKFFPLATLPVLLDHLIDNIVECKLIISD